MSTPNDPNAKFVAWSAPAMIAGYRSGVEPLTSSYASPLLMQSGILSHTKDLMVLDNACGTGALTSALYEGLSGEQKERLHLICGDSAEGIVDFMQHLIGRQGWKGAEAKVILVQDTNLPSNHFTHVFTMFGFPTIRQSLAGVDECYRMLRPSGVYGSTTWSELPWVSVLEKGYRRIPASESPPSLPPIATLQASLSDGEWDSDSWIKQTLQKKGFEDIKVSKVERSLKWKNVNECVNGVFMGMLVEALKAVWGEEKHAIWGPRLMKSLDEMLKEENGDGEVEWLFQGLVVTAKKPAAG